MNAYANTGIGVDNLEPDVGGYAITRDERNWGVFKVPTLREIEHTAPYMPDGSLKTLEESWITTTRAAIPTKTSMATCGG